MENKKKRIAGILAGIVILLIIGAAILIVDRKESQIKQLNSETLSLGNSIVERDSMLNDLFSTMSEIENTLTVIKQKREQLEIVREEGNIGIKESILNDIKMLDEMLDKSGRKIADLNKKLRESGIQVASLNRKVMDLAENLERQTAETELLKRDLEESNLMIAGLNGQVEELSTEIVKKDQSITQKSEIISKQDIELNKGYLAYGTYKQLKGDGVLEKEGGFLGMIARNKSICDSIDSGRFIKLDIRETREIPLFTKKARIITEHPGNSYNFQYENGLVTYLEIENPDEFWRISKYAVIETR